MAKRTCKVDGCERDLNVEKLVGYGMCGMHYRRWKKHGDPHYVRPKRQGVALCVIEGCSGVITAHDWCSKHYTRWIRHGDPNARLAGEVVDGKRICPRCNEDKPLSDWGKGACRECLAKRVADRRRKNPAPPKRDVACVCDYCGTPFMGNKRRRRYCSSDCAEAGKNRANWPHMVARRARLRDAFVESFDRLEIFERDGWVCGICGEPVDPAAKWPSAMSASLDHIVPVARGGKHSRANAQCAHLFCNVQKGASVA